MALGSKNSVAVVRTWTFMIIFCFAGCAAGSCLSYGHSCWGAHGKRSGGHNNAHLVPSKTVNDMQQISPTLPKEQLILSRLISRPLIPNKYRGRWSKLFKIKTNFPDQWDDGELNARFISDEPLRDQNNNEDMDEDGRKYIDDVQIVTGNINDAKKDIPEILLISSNENNIHDSKPQNVEFFKFLSDANGNFE